MLLAPGSNPNSASTTFGNGEAQTRTTGAGYPNGGNNDLLEFFKRLAQRQMAGQRPVGPPQMAGGGARPPRPPTTGGPPMERPSQGPQVYHGEQDYGPYGPTPEQLSDGMRMNSHGQWGTFVDAAKIPAALQDKIRGGLYGGTGNWDTSNPQIMGPNQWGAANYQHSGAVSFPQGYGGPAAPPEDPETWRRQQAFSQFPTGVPK